MNAFKKTFALTLLISACGNSVAMEQEGQTRAETPVTPDTQGLLAVQADMQDAMYQAEVHPSASESTGEEEGAGASADDAAKGVLPTTSEGDADLADGAVDVPAHQAAVEGELGAPEEQVGEVFLRGAYRQLEQSVPEQVSGGTDEQASEPVDEAPVQAPNPEAPAANAAPAIAPKFYRSALDLLKEVPGYCTASYLIKDGGRDTSKDNLIAQKYNLMITAGIYAVIVSAISGGVYGITKLFKNAAEAKEASADDALVESQVNSSKLERAQSLANLLKYKPVK